MFYAHTKENQAESNWQLLKDHLKNTANIAQSFAGSSKYSDVFFLSGLLHDFGKYQLNFQQYLKDGGRKGSVPHASWGAGFARILGLNEISFAIDGHHKGLPNVSDWKADTDDYKNETVSNFDLIKNNFTSELSFDEAKAITGKIKFSEILERELFIRFIFSALIDADGLDTEHFCDTDKSKVRKSRILDCDLLLKKIEENIEEKAQDGQLNILRNSVREDAIFKSEMKPAFYSLNLPTGMGKTLTSVSWALHHAKKNQLKRIIIVLPYVNIIDQTAKTLKDIFGEEWVLEHHSSYNESGKDSDDEHIDEIKKRLATENWDYPVIVTTTVQFFESIFSNKRSKCRKFHNLADSIVIFDEVQTLRKEVVLPTLTMLKNMNSIMRTSFLFCTATQPAFEKRDNFDGIDNIIPLVENIEELFRKTRRVKYFPVNDFKDISMEDLFSDVTKDESSTLCIFNTKKSALTFFAHAKGTGIWEEHYHLSTSMCPNHRKQIIESIRDSLKKGIRILVSSTQLIEAGVDLDFQRVFREYAPMESIIQSAGRCNREGKMPEYGKVYIFKLGDSGMPDKQYKSLSQHTLDMIKENPEGLYTHDFFKDYYKSALNLFVDADKHCIDSARSEFNFETVADSYRIIDKATKGIFIYDFNDESRELHRIIRLTIDRNHFVPRDLFQQLQMYSVQVYDHFLVKAKDLFEALPQDIRIWHGKYTNDTGIIDNPLTADELVI